MASTSKNASRKQLDNGNSASTSTNNNNNNNTSATEKNGDNSNTDKANNGNNTSIAPEFYHELHSILDTKPPISKEKMNQIVKEALKSHRFYKHVVYYVETFIKNVSSSIFFSMPDFFLIKKSLKYSFPFSVCPNTKYLAFM